MRNSQDLNQSPSLRRLSPVVILQNFKNVNLQDSLTRNLTSAKVVIESPMKLPSPTDSKLDKDAFLNLFNLKPRASKQDDLSEKQAAEDVTKQEICPRVSRSSILQLGLSSNGGQKFLHRHLTPNPTEQVVKYEKFCYVSNKYICNITNPRDRGESNFTVTYSEKEQPYIHQYSFNKQQRLERLRTISTGLSKRSRKLLQQCKRAKVYLKNISEKDIKQLSSLLTVERPPAKSIELIDLVDSDEENAPNGSSLSSNKTCTVVKNSTLAKGLVHKAPSNRNGILFPVQNKITPLVMLKSLATHAEPVAKQHFLSKNLTPGVKRTHELATNSIVRKSPRKWNNSALEKNSDSDSDVEIISWNKQKTGTCKANNAKSVGLKAYSTKGTSLDIPKIYSSTNGVLLKCKLCSFVEICDIRLLKQIIQRHMKFCHRGWKEVVVVHRMETCPVRKRLMFVAEAHVKDPIVN